METLATLLARKAALDTEIQRETLIAYYEREGLFAASQLLEANSANAPALRLRRDYCDRIANILRDNRTNGLSLKDACDIAGINSIRR